MSEVGCLRDGHFNNLQIDGYLVTGSTNTSIEELIQAEIQSAFSGEGTLRRTYISTGTDLAGTQHTVDSSDGAVNFFKWTSGVQLFSYNIGEQSTTLGIPQRNIHGYDIAGDQNSGKGKSYITSLQNTEYSDSYVDNPYIPDDDSQDGFNYVYYTNAPRSILPNLPFKSTNSGLIAKFIVEIPNISGVNKLQLGIRALRDSGAVAFNNLGDYDKSAYFSIEPNVSPAGGKIFAIWKDDGSNPIKLEANVDSPTANGIIGDNPAQVWEFVVEITPDLQPKFKCRCQSGGIMGEFREQDITGGGQNVYSVIPPGPNTQIIPFAPFIHCVQGTEPDVSPIILHSLIVNTYGMATSLEGGH